MNYVSTDASIVVNTPYELTITVDRDDAAKMYLNGVELTLTENNAANATDLAIAASIQLGLDGDGNYLDGDITLFEPFNRVLTSDEALAFFNGGPIAALDQWAGAELMPNQVDRDFSAANAWADVDLGAYSESPVLDITAGAAGQYCELVVASAPMTAGKKYRLFYDANVVANGTWDIEDFTGVQTFGTISSTGTQDFIEFTLDMGLTGGFRVVGSANGANLVMDNLSLVQIGATAAYLPENITDAVWTDASSNDNDGVVQGVTMIYEDSWESFWTDYSILGYYGKTNQLIIMRDCTGKWSSGADYGDAWFVDLDNLANTTGRRVFTANVPYTNFVTDWNGDLIISRQSGNDIITEKWTDKPQSQAVGLIDIRTLDLPGAQLATVDTSTDLVIHYKSSAAQTKPISYALDGADAHTAWTRFVGNFLATEEWKRLVIALGSGPIDFAALRLKIGNPTNAGTLEIGPIHLLYTENALKLA